MQVSRLKLQNWRNFTRADVPLTDRMFIVGPNACGKSNFLDVFRFLRDLARPGGGIQSALAQRGGLSKVRSLSARKDPRVQIDVTLSSDNGREVEWRYALALRQEQRGYRRTLVDFERVWKNGQKILDRPEKDDKSDVERLTQSHLEQINSNQAFRPVAKFFEATLYLHLVPQLVRNPEAFSGPGVPSGDPFGRNFLERVARTQKNIRRSRLLRIEKALRAAVPQLRNLTDVVDEAGVPHLEATYEHWRPRAGKQREDQFSDGTLRLVGLLWALLETAPLVLIEEPELSLNAGIVRQLPSVMKRLQRLAAKQILVSTHSFDLLTDRAVGADEVLVLTPSDEGTAVEVADSIREVWELLNGGLSLADALQPRMTSRYVDQLQLAL